MSENPLLHVFDIFASFDWNAQILHLIDNLGDVICLIQFSSDRFHFFLPKGTVSSAPHGILHKLFRNSADLKLMPMVWKPKQCENRNFKEIFLRGKEHLEQKTAEIKNLVSLAVEKI